MAALTEEPQRSRSDADVIAASASDPQAFAAIFERHHDAIHRYVARRLGADMADELAAESFAVGFDKRSRYDHAFVDARPWLYGIATRLVHRHRRREERELRAYARTGVDPIPAPADEGAARRADAQLAGPALAAALASLSSGERDVLLLHAWENLDHSEIAAGLAIAEGTVKSRLHRARRRVRDSLAQAGVLEQKEESDGRA